MNENGPTPSGYADQLRSSFRNLIDPVRDELQRLETEIERREAELGELRKLRTEARHVLYAIDPDSKPQPTSQPKSGRTRAKKNVSDEKVEAVLAWLQTHAADARFSVASVNHGEHGPFDVVPPGTLNFVFQELRDRDAIRLDRVGPLGRKNYRLAV